MIVFLGLRMFLEMGFLELFFGYKSVERVSTFLVFFS